MAKDTSFEFSGEERRSLRPVVIVLLLAAVFLPLTVYAVRYVIELRSSAQPTETPQKIEVTNVSDTSVTISWLTPGAETVGYVKYGTGATPNQVVFDTRDVGESNGRYSLHYVTLSGLNPDTIYYYIILVGGKEYKDGESFYEFQTGSTLESVQAPQPIIGDVEDPTDGSEEFVVYVYAQYGNTRSNKISVLTTNQRYSIDLANVRTEDLSESFIQWEGATLYFLARGANGTDGSIVTLVKQL